MRYTYIFNFNRLYRRVYQWSDYTNLWFHQQCMSSSCPMSIQAIGIGRFYSSGEFTGFNLHLLIINKGEYIQIWFLVIHVSSFMNYLLIWTTFIFFFLVYIFWMLIPFQYVSQVSLLGVWLIFSFYLWYLLMKNNS